jgi:geranylgeranyl reductase
MSFDVIIVGAGPGGLACAEVTASAGLKTLVLERKQAIGKKVCAGGVTWNGLVKKVPIALSERQFTTQHIFTRHQKITVAAATPIIATVNREKLGQEMGRKAMQAGAEIRLGCQVTAINDNKLTFLDISTKNQQKLNFSYLVGADGSSSLIRRYLGIPVHNIGIGINYQLSGNYPDMTWHLDSALFKSGYAWVFPHKETVSVGAYVDARVMKAKKLQESLLKWAKKSGYPLSLHKGEAEMINFDYRGFRFKNIFLIGDAAGLASGLTGEGIYPAIVSGEEVARCIIHPDFNPVDLQKMIKNHNRHRRMVFLLGKNQILSTFLAEMIAFGLKKKLLNFTAAEMAH